MRPVIQDDGSRPKLSLQKHLLLVTAGAKALEGTGARRGSMNQQRPSYCIVVVSPEMRMVPVESILIGDRELVRELAPWWNRKLRLWVSM